SAAGSADEAFGRRRTPSTGAAVLSRGIGNTSAAPKHLSCQLAPARILEGYAASVRSRGRSATTTVVAGGRTRRLIALRSARNQARRIVRRSLPRAPTSKYRARGTSRAGTA